MISLITFANRIPKCTHIHVHSHTHTHTEGVHMCMHTPRQCLVKHLSTICSKQVLQKPMPSDVPTVTLWGGLPMSPHVLPSVEGPVVTAQTKDSKNLNSSNTKRTGPQLDYIPYIRERGNSKNIFFRVLFSFWIKK